jgi:hypothetical protein
MAGQAEAVAEGWDPAAWRTVAANLSRILDWTQPVIPGPRAPAPYAAVLASTTSHMRRT